MYEIFIPTTMHGWKTIHEIRKECREIFQMFDDLVEHDFHSDLLSWVSLVFQKEIPEDIIRMCNGEFWIYYFIERDIWNKKVYSSWSTILGNTKLFDSIPSITKTMEQLIHDLSTKSLITRSKMQEIQKKIQDTLFVLSWLIYSLEWLIRVAENNKKEMANYNWEIQYESQAELLGKISEQKMHEILNIKKELYPKLLQFLDIINKII